MGRAAVILIISAQLLFSMGLLMIFNTTAAEIIDRFLDISTHAALFKQIGYGLFGLILGFLTLRFGSENLIRYSYPLLILTTFLLVLVFVPGIGVKINGARRWIGVAGTPIGQPSEAVKILMPAAFIYWFLKQQKPIAFKPFVKMLAFFVIPLALILFEPDNGTVSIICLLLVVLFFLSRIRLLYWAMPLTCLVLLGGGSRPLRCPT